MNRKWAHGRFVAPLKISSSNNSQDSAPNMADEQSYVIEMILFFKKCAVLIALVVIFLLLPCPEKRRDERRNSKDSAAAPDSACSKPQLSKKCIFRILIILTWVLNMHQEKRSCLWYLFWFSCTKMYIELDSKWSKSGVEKVLRKSSFSHISLWENDFPVVKSGFWGHISH